MINDMLFVCVGISDYLEFYERANSELLVLTTLHALNPHSDSVNNLLDANVFAITRTVFV